MKDILLVICLAKQAAANANGDEASVIRLRKTAQNQQVADREWKFTKQGKTGKAAKTGKTMKSLKNSSTKSGKSSKKSFIASDEPTATKVTTSPTTSAPEYQPSTPAPQFLPTTSSPTLVPPSVRYCPLPAPTPIPEDGTSCIPTVGPCIADASTLGTAASQMIPYDVLSLCQGDIRTTETVEISANNATLCCESGSACTLSAPPNDHQILKVTGGDFRLSGIKFYGGYDRISRRGGNLHIESDGHHVIENCDFDYQNEGDHSGGSANVFVRTSHSLTVRGSTFASDTASAYRGGLAVWDAASLQIEHSAFSGSGGGLLTHAEYPRYLDLNYGQHVSIYDSSFEGISEQAFLATNIGYLPSLRIWKTSFVDNDSGVQICCRDKEDYDAMFCDNQGTDNDDPCSSIFVYGESTGPWCMEFDEDHPDGDSISKSSKCSQNDDCATIGLVGSCCPTAGGVMLACFQ